MNSKQATQTDSFCPLSLFGSHLDQLQHFLNLFCFNKCLFLITLTNELPSSTCFFPLCLFMNLDCALVGIVINMLGELGFMSKNPPSTNVDDKSIGCSTLIGCLPSTLAFIVFFSTYPSSSKSLIIMNAGGGGE